MLNSGKKDQYSTSCVEPFSSIVSAHVPVEMMNNMHIPNCDLNKNYSNKIRQIKRLIWEKIKKIF
jgi:hypothetical protein